jgi:hypothetical protein
MKYCLRRVYLREGPSSKARGKVADKNTRWVNNCKLCEVKAPLALFDAYILCGFVCTLPVAGRCPCVQVRRLWAGCTRAQPDQPAYEDFLDFIKCFTACQVPQQTLSNEELIKNGYGNREPWVAHCLGVRLLNWG